MANIEMPKTPVRTRIAPSPTGDPHVGTAYIALFNKALALKTGGKFLLRIEDTDRTRYVAGSEKMIFDALRWLGLVYDEGPDVGGPHAPYRQSERSEHYKRHCADLVAKKQAYHCFCTAERLEVMRKEKEAKKQSPGYDGLCRTLSEADVKAKLAASTPNVVRLAVPRDKNEDVVFHDLLRGEIKISHREVDDQVLMKSDGLPTYHLANVVDDHDMGVTHVIRAEEWISSTPKHVLLYRGFGWQAPSFLHMPLLRNADKTKISKRKNPTSLIWYRDEGFLPETMLNFLGLMGYSMGENREFFSFDEFVAEFDLAKLNASAPVFDLKKLEWLNGEWIRKLAVDDFVKRIMAFFPGKYREDLVRKVSPLIQTRLKKLKDWPELADSFFFGCPAYDAKELHSKKGGPAETAQVLDRTLAIAEKADWKATVLEEQARGAAKDAGMKDGDFFGPIRIAITGKKVSPPLFESMEILGRDESLARLKAARAKV